MAISDSVITFIAVGRFHKAKDYPNLLQAFALFLNKQIDSNKFKLFIVGDGPNELKKLINELILELRLEKMYFY